jgi:hypothetical protein
MTETELSTKTQVPFGLFGLFSLVYSVGLDQAGISSKKFYAEMLMWPLRTP